MTMPPCCRFAGIRCVLARSLVCRRGSYAGISTSGFRDFLLKPELMQAIADAGFEHPSEGTISLTLLMCL